MQHITPVLVKLFGDDWQLALAESLPEFCIAGGIFLLGIVLGRMLKRRVKRSSRATLKGAVALFATPLIAPFVTTLVSGGSFLAAKALDADTTIYLFFFKISVAWFAIRTVSRLTSGKSAGWFIAVVIIPITLLHLFHLWDAARALLISAAVSEGGIHINAYVLLRAIINLVVLFWAAGLLIDFVQARIDRMRYIHVSHRTLIMKLSQIGLYFLVCILGLKMLGIDLTALSVFGGALGVGIGFGLQKIASNFMSGIILLMEKSVQVDDMVELQDGTLGFIRKMGARFTLMQTFDGRDILIPNEDLITQRLVSWTHSNTRARIEIKVGVAYGADIGRARQIMLEAANAHSKCLKDPTPTCVMTDFADSAINLSLYFWIADVVDGRMEPKSDVMHAIWTRFNEEGIEIPFPQRVVHMAKGAAA